MWRWFAKVGGGGHETEGFGRRGSGATGGQVEKKEGCSAGNKTE